MRPSKAGHGCSVRRWLCCKSRGVFMTATAGVVLLFHKFVLVCLPIWLSVAYGMFCVSEHPVGAS